MQSALSLNALTVDLQKLQNIEIEKLAFSLHIKPSNRSVTRPEVNAFLLFIKFSLYYNYNVSVISFT